MELDEDEAAFEADVEAQAKAGDPMAKARAAKAAKAAAAAPSAPVARGGGVLAQALKRVYINGEHTMDNRVAKLETGDKVELKAEFARLYVEGGHVRLA